MFDSLVPIFTPSVVVREWGNRRFHRRGWGCRFVFLGAQRLKPLWLVRRVSVCLKAYPDTNLKPDSHAGSELGAAATRWACLDGRGGRPHMCGSSSLRFYFLRRMSAARKAAKTTEIIPFMVKKAALRRERLLGLTRECS